MGRPWSVHRELDGSVGVLPALVGALAVLAVPVPVPLALPGGGIGRGSGDRRGALLRLLAVLATGLAVLAGSGLGVLLLGVLLLGVELLGMQLLGVRLLLCLRARANRVAVALVGRPRAGRDPERVLALVTDRHLLAVLILRQTDGPLREPDSAERRKRDDRRCDDGNECHPAPASVPPQFLHVRLQLTWLSELVDTARGDARCIYEEPSGVSASSAGNSTLSGLSSLARVRALTLSGPVSTDAMSYQMLHSPGSRRAARCNGTRAARSSPASASASPSNWSPSLDHGIHVRARSAASAACS